MGKILTTLTVEKSGNDGKLLESFTQQSRSWTKHFFDLLFEPLNQGINTLASINDVTSVGRTLGQANTETNYNLGIGSPPGFVSAWFEVSNGGSAGINSVTPYSGDAFGIVIGTDNTAVLPTNDKLGTKIAHGEIATQLLYGGTEIYGFTASNPNASFKIRRYFTNVAGGSISVTESGIYAPAYIGSGQFKIFCVCRDVFGTVTVNNGQILSVVYTVSITV